MLRRPLALVAVMLTPMLLAGCAGPTLTDELEGHWHANRRFQGQSYNLDIYFGPLGPDGNGTMTTVTDFDGYRVEEETYRFLEEDRTIRAMEIEVTDDDGDSRVVAIRFGAGFTSMTMNGGGRMTLVGQETAPSN